MSRQVVLIECIDGRGRTLFRERLVLDSAERVLTVGRSLDADVPLDDEHVAAMHARVEIGPDSQVLVSDLGSMNGIVIAGKRHHGAEKVALVDHTFQVGHTSLRVRTASQSLPPEKPLHRAGLELPFLHEPAWLAGFGALAVGAQVAYSSWLGAPRDMAISVATALATTALVVAIWVAIWALLSRVMVAEWRWLRHFSIALCVWAGATAIDGMLDVGWFVFSLPRWSLRDGLMIVVALGSALLLHLTNASSLSLRHAVQFSVLLPALLGIGGYWYLERSNMRDVNRVVADVMLYPPALRMRRAEDVGAYFQAMDGLRSAANDKRRAIQDDDTDSDAD